MAIQRYLNSEANKMDNKWLMSVYFIKEWLKPYNHNL